MNEKVVRCQVYPEEPSIKIYYKSSMLEVPVESVSFDADGKIVKVLIAKSDSDSETPEYEEVPLEDVVIYQHFLQVPGVGYLKPGTRVCLDDDKYMTTYELSIGWYTNSSNQSMFGWYLHPLDFLKERDPSNYMSCLPQDLFQDRTLYLWMIDHLSKITP